MARSIKKIKTDESGINGPISLTRSIQNTSKNPNQAELLITYQGGEKIYKLLDLARVRFSP